MRRENIPDEDLLCVLPKTAEIKNGHLFVGGQSMVELAQRVGTALYVLDEEHLEHQMRRYFRAMKDRGRVYFAMKANPTVAVLKMALAEGLSILVASGGELFTALKAGIPPDRIMMHGNNKTPSELEEAIRKNVQRIIVDSFDELARINKIAGKQGVTQEVLVRVTPGITPDTHGHIQTGQIDSKFGFGLVDGMAMEAVHRVLDLPNIMLGGLHMHIGSQIFVLHSYEAAIVAIADFMGEVKHLTDIEIDALDVGGGLGIPYGLEDEPSTIEDYCKVVIDGIARECKLRGLKVPQMCIEPGRSVVASAGITLYTIGTVKEIQNVRTYVAVDGGMTDNIRPAMYDAHYEFLVANRADQPRSEIVAIAGKFCETGDILAKDAHVQPIKVDDILVTAATGAYCLSMSSNYNSQVRPAVVMVRDGWYRIVVRRERYEDLTAREIPDAIYLR